MPAPGQGAIVVQGRFGDALSSDLRWLNHIGTALAVRAEREVAAALGAGCSVPLGVFVEFRAGDCWLQAALHDGEKVRRVETRARAGEPHAAVEDAIARFRELGATTGAGT